VRPYTRNLDQPTFATPSKACGVLRNVKHNAGSVEGEVLETHGINGTITVISADAPSFACFFYLY